MRSSFAGLRVVVLGSAFFLLVLSSAHASICPKLLANDEAPEIIQDFRLGRRGSTVEDLEEDVFDLFVLSHSFRPELFVQFSKQFGVNEAEASTILNYYAGRIVEENYASQARTAEFLARLRAQTDGSPAAEDLKSKLAPMFHDGQTLHHIHELPPKQWKQAKDAYYPGENSGLEKWWGIGAHAANSLLWLEVIHQIAQHPNLPTAVAAGAIVLPALFTAEIFQTELHYRLDNEIRETNRWFGSLARDFRIHHEIPDAITKGTYLSRMSELARISVPGFVTSIAMQLTGAAGMIADAALSPFGVPAGTVGPVVDTTFGVAAGVFLFAGMHTTYSHQQAHTKKPPFLWRMIQKVGLGLAPKHHMKHHKPPFEDNYSVLFGWGDGGKTPEYWKNRHLKFWRTKHLMPGTWIQDPRAIPSEVVSELSADYSKIPVELWAYSERAYPSRVPEWLKAPLEFVQAKWRKDFITERRREYREAPDSETARQEWLDEQAKYPWIYGPTPLPL